MSSAATSIPKPPETDDAKRPVKMSHWMKFLTSSIGMKYVMAVSGLMLTSFVLVHMGGNLLIFAGPETYNKYSHSLVSNPLIWVARAGLIVFFLSHIVNGFATAYRNRISKPIKYAVAMGSAKAASWRSKTLVYQGSIVLAFLIFHLATFSLGTYYEVTYNGVVMRDIFRLVIEVFQQPLYVAWYILSLIILIVHLTHGFSSMFQTLGFHHPRYWQPLRVFGFAYAILVGGGFIAVPLYIFFNHAS